MTTVQQYLIILTSLVVLPFTIYGQTVSTVTQLEANGGIAVAGDGTLYIAHFGPLPPNPSVGTNLYSVNPSGEVERLEDITLSVGSGNTIGRDGFLYQSNFVAGNIFKINTVTRQRESTISGMAGPVGIAVATGDTLVACACSANKVVKIAPDGTISDFATGSEFSCPNGITAAPGGYFYTTNFSDGRVTQIAPDGSVQTLGSTPAGNGHLDYRPTDASLYIASYSGHQIFKMDLTGNATLLAGTGAAATIDNDDPLLAAFEKPNGIRFSPDFCTLYISQDEELRKIVFSDPGCMPTSVKPIFGKDCIHVFPNPAASKLFIDAEITIEIAAVNIFNLIGQQVLQETSTLDIIDIEHLQPGLYHIVVTTTGGERFSSAVVIN